MHLLRGVQFYVISVYRNDSLYVPMLQRAKWFPFLHLDAPDQAFALCSLGNCFVPFCKAITHKWWSLKFEWEIILLLAAEAFAWFRDPLVWFSVSLALWTLANLNRCTMAEGRTKYQKLTSTHFIFKYCCNVASEIIPNLKTNWTKKETLGNSSFFATIIWKDKCNKALQSSVGVIYEYCFGFGYT